MCVRLPITGCPARLCEKLEKNRIKEGKQKKKSMTEVGIKRHIRDTQICGI